LEHKKKSKTNSKGEKQERNEKPYKQKEEMRNFREIK
jgi:hypothetical protein